MVGQMTIPLLFLILFIDGFSLSTAVESNITELSIHNSTHKCPHNATTALPPNLPCFTKGHCIEIGMESYVTYEVFVCKPGYHAEYITNNSLGWINDGGISFCKHSTPFFHSQSGEIRQLEHIRCRKDRTCGLDEYYSRPESGDDSEQPKIVTYTNNSISVECDYGELQAYIYDKWNKVQNNKEIFQCDPVRGLILKGENTTVQLLRCYTGCNAENVLKMTDSDCLEPNCTAIRFSDTSISCPSGYFLEGKMFIARWNKELWTYSTTSKIPCRNIYGNEHYTKYRCMKQRGCDADSLYDDSACRVEGKNCPNVEEYENLDNPNEKTYHCDIKEGYHLEYLVDGVKNDTRGDSEFRWEIANHLLCPPSKHGLRIDAWGKYSELLPPQSIRCRKSEGCDLKEFYSEDCPSRLECQEPTQLSDFFQTIICKDDYRLQVYWLGDDLITNEQMIYCIQNRVQVINPSGEYVDRPFHPQTFKCVRLNLKEFFDAADCNENAKCDLPRNHKSLVCDPPYGLQMKIKGGTWRDVKSAKSEWDYFDINFQDGTSVNHTHASIRCIKKLCTQCANPCSSCISTNITRAEFNTPVTWNDCAKFTCGNQSRMITDSKTFVNTAMECSSVDEENAISIWNVNGSTIEANSVKCEYLCTINSPLKSYCHSNDTKCEMWIPKDYNHETCDEKMFYESGNKAVEIIKMKCDLQDGQWKDKYKNIIPTGSNVYCHQGDCEESRIFPSCNEDYGKDSSSTCVDYNSTGHRYFCNNDATFWSRSKEEKDWVKMDNVSEILCLAGKIFANGVLQEYAFQATCRELNPKAGAVTADMGLYVGVTMSILFLIVIVMATIVLRVSGKGWIHTVILEWFRDKKAKKEAYSRRRNAYSVSSKGTMKSPSINSPNISSSRRRSMKKTTNPKAKPSEKQFPSSVDRETTDESTRKRRAEGKLVAV